MSDEAPSGYHIQQAMRIWHERQKIDAGEDAEMLDEAGKDAFAVHTGGLEAIQVAIVRAIRNANMFVTAIKTERQILDVREKRYKARGDGWRNSLAAIVEMVVKPDKKDGVRRLKLPIATITLAPGGRNLQITDEANIPDDFYDEVTMVKVRKGLRKADLERAITEEVVDEETGEVTAPMTIPGVTLSNAPPQLTIRGR